jgi:hypothetical protein
MVEESSHEWRKQGIQKNTSRFLLKGRPVACPPKNSWEHQPFVDLNNHLKYNTNTNAAT